MITDAAIKGKIDKLKEICADNEKCYGFTIDGEFKKIVTPQDEWVKLKTEQKQ